MEFSVSRNNYCDTEDSFSEDSLNPTLSEGYIPCEDTVSCEDTTLQEEITFNVDVSVQLLLTREGRGGMESENSPLNRQDQIQDSSEMVFMQSSALPWHDHDDILVNEDYILQSLLNNLHGYLQSLSDNEENQTDDNENQTDENEDKRDDNENEKSEQIQENDKVEESVFPETSEGHGFQLGSSSSPHMAQMSHGESDTCQDSPRCKSSENKDVAQFPEMTPMLKGQNLTKVVNQAMGNQKASSTEACWTSSVETEKKSTSSNTQTTTCVNCRHSFRWMRKRVCCCVRRRRNAKQSTQSPCQ